MCLHIYINERESKLACDIPHPQPDATQQNETQILQSVGKVSVIEKQALFGACFYVS